MVASSACKSESMSRLGLKKRCPAAAWAPTTGFAVTDSRGFGAPAIAHPAEAGKTNLPLSASHAGAGPPGRAAAFGIHGFHPFLVFFMCRSRLFLMRRRFRGVFWSECLMAVSFLSLVLCRVNLGTPAAPATGATSAAPAGLPRLGLVHRQRPAVHLFTVEGGDGCLGLLLSLHLDEGEALGPPRVAVRDDLGHLHRAVLAEQMLQVTGSDRVGQVADVQFSAHVGPPKEVIGASLPRQGKLRIVRGDRRGVRALDGLRCPSLGDCIAGGSENKSGFPQDTINLSNVALPFAGAQEVPRPCSPRR